MAPKKAQAVAESAFVTWAIVEVMGHTEYAGHVSAETIAGVPMLRVDVPDIEGCPAFTKYLSTHALYGLTPCSEATARAKAAKLQATPVKSWDVEQQLLLRLKQRGLLRLEHEVGSRNDDDRDD